MKYEGKKIEKIRSDPERFFVFLAKVSRWTSSFSYLFFLFKERENKKVREKERVCVCVCLSEDKN